MSDRSTDLAGLICLVTGASRGIGRATAVALADRGATVWGLARSEDALQRLSKEHGVVPVRADLTDDTETWTAIDEAIDEAARVPDLLVNAAGVFGVEACATEAVNHFDAQIQVNLRGTFLVTRALLPGMLERGSGTIVNIGSVAGRKAFPGNAAYSASKFGVRGFHEVLVEELRGTGVRACLIEPAATDTEIWDPLDPDENPSLPNRSDMMKPDDVADAVLFVATRREGVTIPHLAIEPG